MKPKSLLMPVLAALVGIGLSYVLVRVTRGMEDAKSITELPVTKAEHLISSEKEGDKIDEFEQRKADVEARLRPMGGSPQSSADATAAMWLADRPPDGEVVPPVLRTLMKVPEAMEPSRVLHSPDLNPRKLPIPDDVYGPMKDLLQAYHEHLALMEQMKGSVRNEELEQLRVAGVLLDHVGDSALAEAIDATVSKASRSLKESGISEDRFRSRMAAMAKKAGPGAAGFVEYTYKGRKYYYPRDKLIMTTRIADYMRFRGEELALSLVGWASTSGLLYDYERDDVIRKMATTRR